MNRHDPASFQAHDADFYAWTQQQAKLLRTLERSGAEFPPELDIPNLAEEIEDLGKAELRGATSLIRQIMIHLIKAAADPQANAIAHWHTEVYGFHSDLLAYFEPSMRRKIVVSAIWKRALEQAELSLRERRGHVASTIPKECPFVLQDFVSSEFEFDGALARLR